MKIGKIAAFLFFSFVSLENFGQRPGVASIFLADEPLSISFSISMKEVRRNMSDTTYLLSVLRFKDAAGVWDSIQIGVRARGNFRRNHCFFPPLRIKIKKDDARGTLFAGARNLKLVMPCQVAKNYNDLILKEYMCYKLYEPVTQFAFSTRLAAISLTDNGGKNAKTFELTGFLIEDDDAVAKRLQATVIDEKNVRPMNLEDTSALRFDLFQYMIANTDFSTTFLHNTKVIQTNSGRKVPVPYDFDMAGFVNAPYATFDESLGIRSVRDRLYKGYCRNEDIAAFVRQQYVALEPELIKVLDDHQSFFDTKEFEGIKKYMNGFFTILKDDGYYKTNISQKCRER